MEKRFGIEIVKCWIWHWSLGKKSENKQVRQYQTKIFLSHKGNSQKMKRQSTELEDIFLNHMSYKRLILKNISGIHTAK